MIRGSSAVIRPATFRRRIGPPPVGGKRRGREACMERMEQAEYTYHSSVAYPHHRLVLPKLEAAIRGGPVLELGCGGGALTADLRRRTIYEIVGVDSSRSAIEQARSLGGEFHCHDLSQALPLSLPGRFATVTAVEVIEHLYLPAELFRRAEEALGSCGQLVLSTPYHGWLKNVAIAVSNRFDAHVNPLWDHGHIKFFSPKTLVAFGGILRVGTGSVTAARPDATAGENDVGDIPTDGC